jgi:hypothetical protein
MPPAKGKEATQALHFRRGDVAGQLARPLRATLTSPAPTPDTVAKSPDARFVQNLTVTTPSSSALRKARTRASSWCWIRSRRSHSGWRHPLVD